MRILHHRLRVLLHPIHQLRPIHTDILTVATLQSEIPLVKTSHFCQHDFLFVTEPGFHVFLVELLAGEFLLEGG